MASAGPVLALSAGPLDQWQWRNPLPQGNTLLNVACGNGTFVAVGNAGTLLSSTDGSAWVVRDSPTSAPLTHVAFAEGQFVAVGGAILKSPGGTDWTVEESPTSNLLHGIAFGAGRFVAVGDNETLATSTDATHWTVTGGSNWSSLKAVAYGNGAFVALGDSGRLLTSPNGTSWTPHALDPGELPFDLAAGSIWLTDLTFGAGQFVAVGGYARARYDRTSVILTSTDGVHWTSREPNGYGFLYGVVRGEDLFVAVGGVAILGWMSSTILISPDGIHWSSRSPDYGSQVLHGVTYGQGRFVAVGELGSALHSADGVHWNTQHASPRAQLHAVASGKGVLVAVGDAPFERSNGSAPSTILCSTDGLDWTAAKSPGEAPLTGISFGDGVFVAVSTASFGGDPETYRSSILSSSNGLHWERQLVLENQWLTGVTWGDGRFVAVGGPGTLLTSPDGFAWTRLSASAEIGLGAVAYAGRRFVAISGAAQILTSFDGTRWSAEPMPTDRWMNSVAGGGGTIVIAAGDRILTSIDGSSWHVTSLAEHASLSVVSYVKDRFLATDGSLLYTSADGLSWQSRPLPPGISGATINAFVEHRDTVVGVGAHGAIVQSDLSTETAPAVILDPVEATVSVGGSRSLVGRAQGAAPLHYQWLKNDAPIPRAVDPVLTLKSVTADDTASYRLAVSNALARVVSAPVSLTVTPVAVGPARLEVTLSGLAQVTITGPSGSRCRVESIDALDGAATWQCRRVLSLGSGPFSWIDPSPAEATHRFYRVDTLP